MTNADVPDPSYQLTYQMSPELLKLRKLLSPLPFRHCLTFALCCCERLYPDYQAHMAAIHAPDGLRPILDRLRQHVLGQEMTEGELQQASAVCRSLPLGEERDSEHYWDALDAVVATAVTLRACREYPLDNVVRAAQTARNKVDQPLWKELSQEYVGGISPQELQYIHAAIRAHPSMVEDMDKQATQLRLLYECEELTKDAIDRILSA